MHLAIPFALLMGSLAAAAPSFQHGQINVEATHSGSNNQADALYSSAKQVINDDDDDDDGPPRLSNLPFNFTLIAHLALGIHKSKLPFGFADLSMKDGFNRGELGYETEFALLNGKLRNGNRALAWHVAKILPPWTSLWSFNKDDPHKYFDFVAAPHLLGETKHYFLEFISTRKFDFSPGWPGPFWRLASGVWRLASGLFYATNISILLCSHSIFKIGY